GGHASEDLRFVEAQDLRTPHTTPRIGILHLPAVRLDERIGQGVLRHPGLVVVRDVAGLRLSAWIAIGVTAEVDGRRLLARGADESAAHREREDRPHAGHLSGGWRLGTGGWQFRTTGWLAPGADHRRSGEQENIWYVFEFVGLLLPVAGRWSFSNTQ